MFKGAAGHHQAVAQTHFSSLCPTLNISAGENFATLLTSEILLSQDFPHPQGAGGSTAIHPPTIFHNRRGVKKGKGAAVATDHTAK